MRYAKQQFLIDGLGVVLLLAIAAVCIVGGA